MTDVIKKNREESVCPSVPKKTIFSEINTVTKMVELSGGQDGFKILQVKFDTESQCPHHIFFKNHNVKAGCSRNDFFKVKTYFARYFSIFFTERQ
jgi:hypothetical protein